MSPLYPRKEPPVPVASEAGWPPQLSGRRAKRGKSLVGAGIRTQHSSARSAVTVPTAILRLLDSEGRLFKNVVYTV